MSKISNYLNKKIYFYFLPGTPGQSLNESIMSSVTCLGLIKSYIILCLNLNGLYGPS